MTRGSEIRIGREPSTTTAEEVRAGRSPSADELERLAREEGVRGILNLNFEGEPGEVLSPNAEATWAHTFELEHRRLSVEPSTIRRDEVAAFRGVLAGVSKPVFVHSLGGSRAAALVTIDLAVRRGLGDRAALELADARGIDCGELAGAVAAVLDRGRT